MKLLNFVNSILTFWMGAVGIGGGSVYIRNGSNVSALSGDVTSGTESSSCAGFFCLGFVEVSGGSTLTATGGNVYANSGEINTLGMVVVGLLTVDDNCSVVATAGDARYNGEAQETARSIGPSSSSILNASDTISALTSLPNQVISSSPSGHPFFLSFSNALSRYFSSTPGNSCLNILLSIFSFSFHAETVATLPRVLDNIATILFKFICYLQRLEHNRNPKIAKT